MKRVLGIIGVVTASLAVTAGAATAKDYADTALNVQPSGQLGNVPC